MRTRTKGLYLHLPSHRKFFAKAIGTEDLPMPASLARRVYGLQLDNPMNIKPAQPMGAITRIEITDCAGSSIPGHQLVDVYRTNDSRTYPLMDSEPTHRARVACFVAACRLRGIPVTGEVN